MKRLFTIITAFAMALALAACAGVPKEKIEAVGTKYESLGDAYVAITDTFIEVAALAEQAGRDVSKERETIAALGGVISALGEEISNNLAKLNEEEVDKLLSELDASVLAVNDMEARLRGLAFD